MDSEGHPDGWGDDSLTDFFDRARANSFAAFANLEVQTGQLIELDGLLVRAMALLVREPDPVPVALFIRCHSAWRAGCQLVMSALLPEFYAVSRVALEYALYGYDLKQHPELQEPWLRRHDNDAARRRVAAAFRPKRLLEEVSTADSVTGKVAKILYDGCIDYGAHPNDRAVTSNSALQRLDEGFELTVNYLGTDGPALRSALRVAAQVAVVSLDLMRLAEPSVLDDVDLYAHVDRIRRAG